MATKKVHIIKTGVANIASMMAAFRRLGGEPELTENPDHVRGDDWVVLPGVGSFGAGMQRIEELGMREALVERAAAGKPLLAVCLGLQLLCAESEESAGVEGLGIVPAKITRFPDTVRIPQFGWNRVVADESCRLLTSGYAYFANSYRLQEAPEGWSPAMAEHGGPFVAAMERDNILACQFHPEISGKWGLGLLERWLQC
jgi:imidazole glycerol phosphate synthase glutamine amidotransferase subunit